MSDTADRIRAAIQGITGLPDALQKHISEALADLQTLSGSEDIQISRMLIRKITQQGE